MKLTVFLILLSVISVFASKTYSQTKAITLKMGNSTVKEVLQNIEDQSEFVFMYSEKLVDVKRKVSINIEDKKVNQVLDELFAGTDVNYKVKDRFILLTTPEVTGNDLMILQQKSISGTITDESGEPLPGASVVVKGTTQGAVSNSDGNYILTNIPDNATLVFSFVGMRTQEVLVGDQSTIDVTMEVDAVGIEEVVAIGYGTMKKSDLTGAISSISMEKQRDLPNISIVESLQGSIAGLNVGQVNQAGEEPSLSIRGRTSLSGTQNPLIVLDGVIYRGNIIDINPNDVETVDVLKDASAAAVYGSQAANGVIIISTSKAAGKKTMRPTINYSAKYSFESPTKELIPGNGAYFVEKISENEWPESRTAESGYTEPNPNWTVTPLFKTGQEAQNYLDGMDTPWYDILTNQHMYVNNHNLSIANRNDFGNYFISIGYTDEKGYMLNDGYKRLNARINIDSKVTDWLTVGVQAFASSSDYSGVSPSPSGRYTMPFEAAYLPDGTVNPLIENAFTSELMRAQADNLDIRQNLFGNVYATVELPIEGLSYNVNLSDNQVTNRDYLFEPFAENFQGFGSKSHSISNNMSFDNRLTYKRTFSDMHNVEATVVYGIEERKYDNTGASASIFINDVLGYNALDFGSSELQVANSGAWKEASLFTMVRLFYSFKNKYLFTGTFRRDGFSGFSENHKFGHFPSASIGWVVSEEPFFEKWKNVMNYLKLRGSYGASGNRTIGRYQTLAKVSGGFNYVDENGASIYTQSIASLASPNLKWETTTGINIGVDFGFLKTRVNGSLNYYNNNTTNLLYNVDIPSIGRFSQFPDNLGEMHNSGFEITVSSINFKKAHFSWTTDFTFSRNRDKLKKLLGADNDGDGKEDDLISEGLFIGEPLNSIYTYEITGEKYQLGDEVPSGYDYGSYIVVDQNDDGAIDPTNDKKIIGYRDPSYRFSINNQFQYKNWAFSFFINSIQGGKNYYMAYNDLASLQYGDQYNVSYPLGYDDYWMPENPNAKYQNTSKAQNSSTNGAIYAQRSFIRLQDVTLGYTFKRGLLNKIRANSLKLFLSGKNLITLTNWEGWDPETGQGITRNGTPVIKSYTVGLSIEF